MQSEMVANSPHFWENGAHQARSGKRTDRVNVMNDELQVIDLEVGDGNADRGISSRAGDEERNGASTAMISYSAADGGLTLAGGRIGRRLAGDRAGATPRALYSASPRWSMRFAGALVC